MNETTSDWTGQETRAQLPVLSFAGVARRYREGDGWLEILCGAEGRLWPGQAVALVAPSGAGKSTLLHIAGLLERPDSGEVTIDGRDTSPLDDSARTALRRDRIGFVYQLHHLLPEFTALENVMMPQLIAGLRQARGAQAGAGPARLSGPGRPREPSSLGAFRRRAAARRDLPGGGQCAGPAARGRAHRQSRPRHRGKGVLRPDDAGARDRVGGADRDSQPRTRRPYG